MMKLPFRSSSNAPPPAATLVAARELTGDTDLLAPTSTARFDIRLTSAGMTVGPSPGGGAVVPMLVVASHLVGFSADQWGTVDEGFTGQVLEIVVRDPGDVDETLVRKFLVA